MSPLPATVSSQSQESTESYLKLVAESRAQRDTMLQEVEQAEQRANLLSLFLTVGTLVLLGVELFVLLTGRLLSENLVSTVGHLIDQFGRLSVISFCWGFTLLFMGVLYWRLPARRKAAQLKVHLEELDRENLRRRIANPNERLLALREQLSRLTDQTALVLVDSDEQYQKATKWRDDAEALLEAGSLSKAQSLLALMNELIIREKGEQRHQKLSRYLTMVIIAAFVASIATVIALSSLFKWDKNFTIPLVELEISVLIWGALGSLAAVLYRVYNTLVRNRFDVEVRWLMARPIIGVIMSGFSVLAARTGLLVANGLAGNTSTGNNQLQMYWIIAFLAGFSDKFYIQIVELLVKKLGNDEPQPPAQRGPPTPSRKSGTPPPQGSGDSSGSSTPPPPAKGAGVTPPAAKGGGPLPVNEGTDSTPSHAEGDSPTPEPKREDDSTNRSTGDGTSPH